MFPAIKLWWQARDVSNGLRDGVVESWDDELN